MVAWTQLLLVACMIALGASQTCDDITCCSGWVCTYMAPGASGTNWTKCVQATSCDQLDCPHGHVCVSEPRGFGAPPKVRCQASCDAVECPNFLQCVERVSGTECVIPDDCLLVECPFGTDCKMHQIGNKMAAVCLGESCDSVECFDGSKCFDSRNNTDKTKPRTSSPGKVERFGMCLPTCEGADICPPGLVCDIKNHNIVCRQPRSCDELECPVGQECQEVKCEHGRAHGRTRTNSTRGHGNTLVHCVDVDSPTSVTAAPTETDPPVSTETDPPVATETDPPVATETDPPVATETVPPVLER